MLRSLRQPRAGGARRSRALAPAGRSIRHSACPLPPRPHRRTRRPLRRRQRTAHSVRPGRNGLDLRSSGKSWSGTARISLAGTSEAVPFSVLGHSPVLRTWEMPAGRPPHLRARSFPLRGRRSPTTLEAASAKQRTPVRHCDLARLARSSRPTFFALAAAGRFAARLHCTAGRGAALDGRGAPERCLGFPGKSLLPTPLGRRAAQTACPPPLDASAAPAPWTVAGGPSGVSLAAG